MNNQDVIQTLRQVIKELEKRLAELIRMRKVPGGPLEERMDRQMQIHARISSLNIQILHLKTRLHDREMAVSLAAAVPPLSSGRKSAMDKALKKVSEEIAAVQTFQGAIALAEAISSAANQGASAAALSP